MAEAVIWPRPGDAAGYARAALYEHRHDDPRRFQVLAAEDLQQDPTPVLLDPMVRLVLLVHHDASEPYYLFDSGSPAVTACYEVEFNYYDVVSGPDRMACPENPVPYSPPPLAPPWIVPHGSDEALRAVLAGMPGRVDESAVTSAVTAALPPPMTDPETGLTARAPEVEVIVRDVGIGVALRGGNTGDGIDCVFGVREGAKVVVWHAGDEVQPGELSCTAETALSFADR